MLTPRLVPTTCRLVASFRAHDLSCSGEFPRLASENDAWATSVPHCVHLTTEALMQHGGPRTGSSSLRRRDSGIQMGTSP